MNGFAQSLPSTSICGGTMPSGSCSTKRSSTACKRTRKRPKRNPATSRAPAKTTNRIALRRRQRCAGTASARPAFELLSRRRRMSEMTMSDDNVIAKSSKALTGCGGIHDVINRAMSRSSILDCDLQSRSGPAIRRLPQAARAAPRRFATGCTTAERRPKSATYCILRRAPRRLASNARAE